MPTRFIGAQVRLRVDDERVLVVLAGVGEGQVIAEHGLAAPGGVSVQDDHYGGPRPAPRRAVRPKTLAEKEFCALGPIAQAFLAGAAAAGNTRLGPDLVELNALAAAHGTEVFLAALSRAVDFGRWRAADVRAILAVHTGTGLAAPQPRQPGEALVLPFPTVPTRPLSAYAVTSPDAQAEALTAQAAIDACESS